MSYPLLRIGLTRAQDSFTLKVSPRPTTGADTAPPFFYPIHAISYCTAIPTQCYAPPVYSYKTPYGLHLPINIRPAESVCPCVCGANRNCYHHTHWNTRRNSVLDIWGFGQDRVFFLYHTESYGRRAIELFISLFDKKRHFYPSALRPFFIAF